MSWVFLGLTEVKIEKSLLYSSKEKYSTRLTHAFSPPIMMSGLMENQGLTVREMFKDEISLKIITQQSVFVCRIKI